MEAMNALEELASRVTRGERITDADARTAAASPDLLGIGMMADEIRRRMHGARTTFVRVFEVHVETPLVALPPGLAAGEVRIIGRPSSLDAAVRAVRAAAGQRVGVPLTGFAMNDLEELAGTTGDTLAVVCAALRDAGLDGISELPLDAVSDAAAATHAARGAGLSVMRLTVHAPGDARKPTLILAGIPTLMLARELQSVAGGFKAFAPLPRTMSVSAPSTGYDDVKHVALARMLVDNIESIQVDWALYGPKLAQVALTVGADDVDNVAAIDAGTLGTRRSPIEEIRGNIRAASLDPVERNGRFELLAS
jgi:aminodeoxyfutalosine synthase